MNLNLETAEIFIPDDTPVEDALARTTHMGIGAHQDDLEVMAYHGILECFHREDRWFCGVVVTNGSGSPRSGPYGRYTGQEMQRVRRREQKKAAVIGDYGAQVLLDYPSEVVKDPAQQGPVQDLQSLLRAARPDVVHTHNLADKHDTHVAVALRVLQAIRGLPAGERPRKLYGGEVWRDLDWMVDTDKVILDVSPHPHLQAALLGVFDSQISGGKRYDLATIGRRRAHATYLASHATDEATAVTFAMDLTPLIDDTGLDPVAYVSRLLQHFTWDVEKRLRKFQKETQ
jgi:LmbE family N-acetylglucosaminyl deacetylase